MKKNFKRQQGFTLVEIVLAFAIIAVFITSISYFAFDIMKTKIKGQTVLEVQQNARFAMQKMSYTIRHSAAGIDTGDSQFAPANPGRLHLNMGSGAGDDVVFDVNNGALRMQVGANPAVYLTTNETQITTLTFTNNSVPGGKGNISIKLTMEDRSINDKPEYNYTYSVENSVSIR